MMQEFQEMRKLELPPPLAEQMTDKDGKERPKATGKTKPKIMKLKGAGGARNSSKSESSQEGEARSSEREQRISFETE
jgi:hypothetical protein